MTSSISPAWIHKSFSQIVQEGKRFAQQSKEDPSFRIENYIPQIEPLNSSIYIVQAINIDVKSFSLPCLTVSDQDFSVKVFLNTNCVKYLEENKYNIFNKPITNKKMSKKIVQRSLKNSLFRLKNYYFTTLLNATTSLLKQSSLPSTSYENLNLNSIVLVCTEIAELGDPASGLLGDPSSIYYNKLINDGLSSIDSNSLDSLLPLLHLPSEELYLPEIQGRFIDNLNLSPISSDSNSNILSINDCIIPANQLELIQHFNKFKKSPDQYKFEYYTNFNLVTLPIPLPDFYSSSTLESFKPLDNDEVETQTSSNLSNNKEIISDQVPLSAPTSLLPSTPPPAPVVENVKPFSKPPLLQIPKKDNHPKSIIEEFFVKSDDETKNRNESKIDELKNKVEKKNEALEENENKISKTKISESNILKSNEFKQVDYHSGNNTESGSESDDFDGKIRIIKKVPTTPNRLVQPIHDTSPRKYITPSHSIPPTPLKIKPPSHIISPSLINNNPTIVIKQALSQSTTLVGDVSALQTPKKPQQIIPSPGISLREKNRSENSPSFLLGQLSQQTVSSFITSQLELPYSTSPMPHILSSPPQQHYESLIGVQIVKDNVIGVITDYQIPYYRIEYDDETCEHLIYYELKKYLSESEIGRYFPNSDSTQSQPLSKKIDFNSYSSLTPSSSSFESFSGSNYLNQLLSQEEPESSEIDPFTLYLSQNFSSQNSIPLNQLARKSQNSEETVLEEKPIKKKRSSKDNSSIEDDIPRKKSKKSKKQEVKQIKIKTESPESDLEEDLTFFITSEKKKIESDLTQDLNLNIGAIKKFSASKYLMQLEPLEDL